MGKTFKDSPRDTYRKLTQRTFDRKIVECLDEGNFKKVKRFTKNKKRDREYEQQESID